MKLSLACVALFFASSTAFTVPASSPTSSALYSGVERNENFAKLAGGYLFPEIGRRRNAFLEKVRKRSLCRGV